MFVCRTLSEAKCLNKNLSNAPKRPVVEWRKRGSICVFLPPKDLREFMYVRADPGPPKPQTNSSYLVNLQPQRPNNEESPHLSSFAARRVYSRQELFPLRSQKYRDQEFRTCPGRLKANGLLRYRGARRSRGEKPYASQKWNPLIPVSGGGK